jgi:hypothetical protein
MRLHDQIRAGAVFSEHKPEVLGVLSHQLHIIFKLCMNAQLDFDTTYTVTA